MIYTSGTLYITSCGSDSVVKIHTVKSGEVSEFGTITILRYNGAWQDSILYRYQLIFTSFV